MFKNIRRIFFLGLITIAPIGLTVYVLIGLFRWFDSIFQPFIPPAFSEAVPGLGVVVGIIVVFCVGLMAPSLVGKQFIILTEKIVARVPLAKLIYSGTKQIFDSFSTSNISRFNSVVMVPFPKDGCYSIGFVTQQKDEGWMPGRSDIKFSVFVPTTPNPTSGYLIFVNESDVVPLDMSVEEALKLIISCGLVKSSSTPTLIP